MNIILLLAFNSFATLDQTIFAFTRECPFTRPKAKGKTFRDYLHGDRATGTEGVSLS